MALPSTLIAGSKGRPSGSNRHLFRHRIGIMDFNISDHTPEPKLFGSRGKRPQAVRWYETGCMIASFNAEPVAVVPGGKGQSTKASTRTGRLTVDL